MEKFAGTLFSWPVRAIVRVWPPHATGESMPCGLELRLYLLGDKCSIGFVRIASDCPNDPSEPRSQFSRIECGTAFADRSGANSRVRPEHVEPHDAFGSHSILTSRCGANDSDSDRRVLPGVRA